MPPRVALTLNQDEAEALYLIMRYVGGDPERTRRRHADAIRDALDEVGVHRESGLSNDVEGVIYFKS